MLSSAAASAAPIADITTPATSIARQAVFFIGTVLRGLIFPADPADEATSPRVLATPWPSPVSPRRHPSAEHDSPGQEDLQAKPAQPGQHQPSPERPRPPGRRPRRRHRLLQLLAVLHEAQLPAFRQSLPVRCAQRFAVPLALISPSPSRKRRNRLALRTDKSPAHPPPLSRAKALPAVRSIAA